VLGAGDEVSEVFLGRDIGDRDFAQRDRAVVRVAMAAAGPLARITDPSPADLAPLARRVLRCFLEGDSDKQAAARLGLTRHTVNGYAKAFYRHFGVVTLAELLARWVRRGWGGRCSWAN
jgi:DNA-binding CsgD family transcriptional regulator